MKAFDEMHSLQFENDSVDGIPIVEVYAEGFWWQHPHGMFRINDL